MEKIIDPIPTELLLEELNDDTFFRDTNKGGNRLYIIDGRRQRNVMAEIGRLREIAFRAAGGGTGKACDIDEFDTMDAPCRQLVVWDPEAQMILGGYRFITGDEIYVDPATRAPRIATSHMFHFSERFLNDYLPATIELGRSFVRLEYQSTRAGVKAIFALDNLWDGLGALTVKYPSIRYFFGKVTMYPSYSVECRNLILYFLNKHFPDPDRLVTPIEPLAVDYDLAAMQALFTADDFATDYRTLRQAVRSHGYDIPPLVNAYMSLSPTMRMFGTAINHEFGEVEESGIFFALADIFESKKHRHIPSYGS